MPDPRTKLDALIEKYAAVCGHCDAGLPMNCTCTGDPRYAVQTLGAVVRTVLDVADRVDAVLEGDKTMCGCQKRGITLATRQAIATQLGDDDAE